MTFSLRYQSSGFNVPRRASRGSAVECVSLVTSQCETGTQMRKTHRFLEYSEREKRENMLKMINLASFTQPDLLISSVGHKEDIYQYVLAALLTL